MGFFVGSDVGLCEGEAEGEGEFVGFIVAAGVWDAEGGALKEPSGIAAEGEACPCSVSDKGELVWRLLSVCRPALGERAESACPAHPQSSARIKNSITSLYCFFIFYQSYL